MSSEANDINENEIEENGENCNEESEAEAEEIEKTEEDNIAQDLECSIGSKDTSDIFNIFGNNCIYYFF